MKKSIAIISILCISVIFLYGCANQCGSDLLAKNSAQQSNHFYAGAGVGVSQ